MVRECAGENETEKRAFGDGIELGRWVGWGIIIICWASKYLCFFHQKEDFFFPMGRTSSHLCFVCIQVDVVCVMMMMVGSSTYMCWVRCSLVYGWYGWYVSLIIVEKGGMDRRTPPVGYRDNLFLILVHPLPLENKGFSLLSLSRTRCYGMVWYVEYIFSLPQMSRYAGRRV